MNENKEAITYLTEELTKISKQLLAFNQGGEYYELEHGDEGFMVSMESYNLLTVQKNHLLGRIRWLMRK